jgi:hypothetical protein
MNQSWSCRAEIHATAGIRHEPRRRAKNLLVHNSFFGLARARAGVSARSREVAV